MQFRNEENIPRRIRYYTGSLDQTNLKPGELHGVRYQNTIAAGIDYPIPENILISYLEQKGKASKA